MENRNRIQSLILLLAIEAILIIPCIAYSYFEKSINPTLYPSYYGRNSNRYNSQKLMASNLITAVKKDDSGAALRLEKASLSIGSNNLIQDIDWTILPKERWALVGKNGAGKSTLLKALTGTGEENVEISQGNVYMSYKARLGYLEQKGVSGSTLTVREEVSSRMDRLMLAKQDLEFWENRVSGGDTSDEALEKFEKASIEFEAAGGFKVNQKIGTVLKGLGFALDDYDRLCSEFSGGWQMRIALARLLLSEPDLLILDEPTNHLDRAAREWLGKYLSRYEGTLLLVSHDEELLKVAVSSIAEVRGGKIELYKSRSHEKWLVEREERVRDAQSSYDAAQREIARLQTFVDRFGAKTMGANMAQSRLKTIAKIESTGPQAPVVTDGSKTVLRFPKPPRGSQVLLQLTDATLGWKSSTPSHENEVTTIVRDCNIVIERGMRIAVRGPNGAGKSTLITALSGKLPPLTGNRIEGDGLELGVFTQDLAQDLDQNARAVDVVTSAVRIKDPSISDEKARNVLGTLGLTLDKSIRLVGHLSGGEKARVALASFVLIPHNLLLLDEPSNHLDVTTLEVLTEALKTFTGSVVIISHDRHFVEQLDPTHVISVRGGVVSMEERGLRESDWDDPLDGKNETEPKFQKSNEVKKPSKESNKEMKPSGDTKSKAVSATSPSKAKSSNNPKSKIKKIEQSIEKHKQELNEIDELSTKANEAKNWKTVKELATKRNEIQVKMDELYLEYEELIELIL